MNNKKLNEKELKHILKKYKPLPLWIKKTFITIFIILAAIALGCFLTFFPFFNGISAWNTFSKKWSENPNFYDLLVFLSPYTTLILIAWGVTLKTLETILYWKKRKKHIEYNKKKGIVMKPKETLKDIELRERKINETFMNLMKVIKDDQDILVKGSTPFQIRSIIADYIDDEEKKEKIIEKLKGLDVKVENKAIQKALKDIRKV